MRNPIILLFPLLLGGQREPLRFDIKWVNVPKEPSVLGKNDPVALG